MAGQTEAFDQTLTALRAALAKAEARVARLRQGIIAIEECLGDIQPQVPDRSVAAQRQAGRKGSLVSMSREILRAAGRPMHVKDLVAEIHSRGYRASNPANVKYSVIRSLDRKVKLGQVFTKVAPATYGLREWQEELIE